MSHHYRYKSRDFDFSQRLVSLRKKTGLTQKEVARHVGLAEKSVRNWEGGSNYPTAINLRKLIEIYLGHNAFSPGHEQDEARLLWEQLQERTPSRVDTFDTQWFATLLQAWQARDVSQKHPLTGSQQVPVPQQEPELQGPSSSRPSAHLPKGDWYEALDASSWYGRSEELAQLESWLLTDQCRLITVLGMGGIGKTTLAAKLVQRVTSHFDVVLWCSLYNARPLESILYDWLPVLLPYHSIASSPDSEQALALLLGFLQEHRCLVVLDNLETLLQQGNYRPGYEDYATLVRSVAQTHHQSCLLLTSRELTLDLEILPRNYTSVRVFRMSGLDPVACQQLLHEKGLFGKPEDWHELVRRYAGNPLALKIAAEMVQELFARDIAAFLAQGATTFLGIRHLLTQQFERLSSLEQTLMYWLAIEREPVPLETLRLNLWPRPSSTELIEAMYTLSSRSLVERGMQEAVFTLQPVVLEYVTERLVAQVSKEIQENRPALLLTHALLQARAKDYLLNNQMRLILQPVLDRLISHFSTDADLDAHLERLLQQIRSISRTVQGYGAGNVVNLLVRLNGHIKGKDCSHLTVWQANLREAEAQDVSFAESDLTGSTFLESIDGIVSVAFSPNRRYIAAGANNGQIHLWRVQDGQPLLTLAGHHKIAWSLVFNLDSTRLISGGNDGLVKVWDISSGECVQTLLGHTRWLALSLHPAGRLLATCSDDRSIQLWNLQTGDCLKVWREHREIWAITFSPDGTLMASGYGDGVIKLWDHESGVCLWSMEAHRGLAIEALAFSPDGQLLVSGGNDSSIMVWQTSSGRHLGTLTGHTDMVSSVAFNKQGVLASGSADCTVKLWQIDQSHETGIAARCLDTFYGHTNVVWSTAFGPDGLLASGSTDCTVKLWQLNSGSDEGKCLRTLRGYTHLVNAISLSPDGQFLVSNESNGTVKLWEIGKERCLHISFKQIGEFSALAFSPDGRFVAQSFLDHTIRLWEVVSRQCVKTFSGHSEQVCSLVFSPDGRFLLSGSFDRTVRLWDVEGERCITTFQGHNHWVWSLACSPDGRLLASGDFDGVIKLWRMDSGECQHTLQSSQHTVQALAFTLDGNRILSSDEQNLVTMWNVQSGDCLKAVPGRGEIGWLGSVRFSPDGSLLAAASTDQTVKLWDVESGELRRSFACYASQPWPVAFSGDQRIMASGTNEGAILLWEILTGECLLRLYRDRPYERMNITGATGLTESQKASLKTLGAFVDSLPG